MAWQSITKTANEWLGHSEPQFTHSREPISLTTASGHQTDLVSVCEEATPPCRINPLLFNGHLQTMWTVTKPRGPPVHYRRRIFDADHATYKGTFAVDFVVPPPPPPTQSERSEPGNAADIAAAGPDGLGLGVPGEEMSARGQERESGALPRRTAWFPDDEWARFASDDTRPQLVVLHGLSGGSHEVYLRQTIEPLIRTGKWEILVVNSRGCAWSRITSGVLYNARATWDVRQVVKWLKKTFPNRPLFGLGFSLGANILTNYIAEEGTSCEFKAAMVCSSPFNLEVCSKLLQSTFVGKEIYLRVMGMAMFELASRHKKEILSYTSIDWDAIQKMKYLHEFDREIQCKTWGYPTEYAYYRDASSSDAVLAIRIPFVAINAQDDPIVPNAAIPYEEFAQNPWTVLITTALGGHLGWFESSGGRWYTQPVCNFLNRMAFDMDFDKISPRKSTPVSAPMAGTDGSLHGHFEPMRRRMEIRIE